MEVRLGSFANGEVRKATYHWSSCKPAHNREGFTPGERPKLGRKSKSRPDPPVDADLLTPESKNDATDVQNKQPVEVPHANSGDINHETSNLEQPQAASKPAKRGKIQNESRSNNIQPESLDQEDIVYSSWSPRPGPGNCNFGPVITREMLDRWGELPPLPERPVRSTRNPKPNYVH